MRIGTGYDVHKLSEGRRLVLGGETIPYEKGLLAHSDGDVLVHAIIDSILGALSEGDIGKMFPDNDSSYKDADSLMLLRRVYDKMDNKGFEIVNIDATIIAQKPKLSAYTENMESNIANVLKVSRDCVNIKATTEEGLGFTGALLGIAAQAVCLIKKKL